jgi:hypothetical protein
MLTQRMVELVQQRWAFVSRVKKGRDPGNRNHISSLASHSDLFESGNKVAWSTWVYFPDVSYVVSEDLHVVLITKSVQFEVYNLYRMSRTAYRTNNGSV